MIDPYSNALLRIVSITIIRFQMQGIEQSFVNRRPLHIIPRILDIEQIEAGKDPIMLEIEIAAFKSKIDDLIAEVYQLNVERQNDKDQHRVLMDKMEQDHQRYCHEIEHYSTNILNLKEYEKREEISFGENCEKERKNSEAMHGVEVSGLSKRLEDLQGEYLELKRFQELEKEYNSRIEKLKATFIEEQYRHHDAMNQKERFEKGETVSAQIRNQEETKKVIKEVHKEAKTKVINEHKEAMGEKMELKAELLVLHKELERLKKTSNTITVKNKETKIKATINIESLEEYRAVGALQIAKIKNFKEKTEDIKSQITNESEKWEKEINKVKESNNQRLEELKGIYKANKKEKGQIEKELENMKGLSLKIIEQRAELEEFFAAAIAKLGKEGGEKAKEGQRIYGEKVDITELDILDKEKILKTLLSKISLGGKHDSI